MVWLSTAVEIVKHSSCVSRVPEPIRLAAEMQKTKNAMDTNTIQQARAV